MAQSNSFMNVYIFGLLLIKLCSIRQSNFTVSKHICFTLLSSFVGLVQDFIGLVIFINGWACAHSAERRNIDIIGIKCPATDKNNNISKRNRIRHKCPGTCLYQRNDHIRVENQTSVSNLWRLTPTILHNHLNKC